MNHDSKKQPNGSLPVIAQIQIKTPCPMNWDEMEGDTAKRYCGSCQKHVHNFAEMDADSVNELVSSGQSICAKIQRRTDGSIVTKVPRISRRNWIARAGAMAASLAAVLTLSGCRDQQPDDLTGIVAPPTTAEAPVLMGEVEGSELGDVVFVDPEPEQQQPHQETEILGKVMPVSK